jgi:uncharacterized protein YndB with AHSA1/START domain
MTAAAAGKEPIMATKQHAKPEITAEPGVPFIDITREFDAPRHLLFRAFTEPDLLVRWLGPRRLTMTIDRYDVRDGGTWRYLHKEPDGREYGFHGVFHGDPTLDGITQTFEFEGWPGHVSLETVSFEERDGRTIVRNHSVYQSIQDRDAMVESGMELGITDGYERLDDVLGELQARAS